MSLPLPPALTPTTAHAGRRPCAPASTCRNRTRRPGPTTSPGATASDDMVDRVHAAGACGGAPSRLDDALGQVGRLVEALGDVAQLQQWRGAAFKCMQRIVALLLVEHAGGNSARHGRRRQRPAAADSRIRRLRAAQRSRKRQPDGRSQQRRRHAGDLRQRLAARVARRRRGDQRPACTGWRGAPAPARTLPSRRCGRHTSPPPCRPGRPPPPGRA